MGERVKPKLHLQYGALPYRFRADGSLEILLVTTRRTGRWIIPKGWKIKSKKPPKSAAQEAYEEAGVRGKVSSRSIGRFVYGKWLDGAAVASPREVVVFPLLVREQQATWRECQDRQVRWVDPGMALTMVEDQGLRDLITAFVDQPGREAKTSGSSQPQGLSGLEPAAAE